MKRIIRLTENDLARIVRRVIKESDDDLFGCIADAYKLGKADVLKLAPCRECQETPTEDNCQECLDAVQKLVKSKGYGILEIAQMTLEASACLTKMNGNNRPIKLPGYGGGMY